MDRRIPFDRSANSSVLTRDLPKRAEAKTASGSVSRSLQRRKQTLFRNFPPHFPQKRLTFNPEGGNARSRGAKPDKRSKLESSKWPFRHSVAFPRTKSGGVPFVGAAFRFVCGQQVDLKLLSIQGNRDTAQKAATRASSRLLWSPAERAHTAHPVMWRFQNKSVFFTLQTFKMSKWHIQHQKTLKSSDTLNSEAFF